VTECGSSSCRRTVLTAQKQRNLNLQQELALSRIVNVISLCHQICTALNFFANSWIRQATANDYRRWDEAVTAVSVRTAVLGCDTVWSGTSTRHKLSQTVNCHRQTVLLRSHNMATVSQCDVMRLSACDGSFLMLYCHCLTQQRFVC
jgi:hypothetical protein